ncbi:hypothetical protein MRX96_050261 [Rhipicephalus microplus]
MESNQSDYTPTRGVVHDGHVVEVRRCQGAQPLAEMFRPGGFNTVIKLIRFLVGANRHTLTAITLSNMTRLFSFCSEQNAQACIASVESARDRFEKTLGDDGVLLLPAATKSAPFHNQDLMFFDSPGMTALFNLFRVPVTVCPVLRLVDGLPLCVQVVGRREETTDYA